MRRPPRSDQVLTLTRVIPDVRAHTSTFLAVNGKCEVVLDSAVEFRERSLFLSPGTLEHTRNLAPELKIQRKVAPERLALTDCGQRTRRAATRSTSS